ncbi:MAG TPA: methanol dehydrogenase, partial [Ignavibacteriales bacterium]|nr:methanol dehydrogenase [Ignavibacteriales bacterium]
MFYLFLFLIFYSSSFAQPELPQLSNWANDYTSTLSPQELQQLNFRLKSYEDTTTNQLVSLMIASLDGYPLEEYSFEVAERNKIGTKEKSNGVLFLVVKNDKKMRIEVGYGLEGVLPDALSSSIIRNEITPYFRKNEYYAGITSGINAIIAAIGSEYKSDFKEKSNGISISGIIILLLIIFIIISFIPKSGRIGRSGGYIYHGGSWGSGGFGGGSSSGFRGFSGGGGAFWGGGGRGGWGVKKKKLG